MKIEIKPALEQLLKQMDLGFSANAQTFRHLIKSSEQLFIDYVIEEHAATKEDLVKIAQKISAFCYEADHWEECHKCFNCEEVENCEACRDVGYIRTRDYICY